jgi:hypothetical protein
MMLATGIVFMLSGCFGPSNSPEEVVNTYIQSMKSGDYKTAESVVGDEFKENLKQRKEHCFEYSETYKKAFDKLMETVTKEQDDCIKKMSSEERKRYTDKLNEAGRKREVKPLSEVYNQCIGDSQKSVLLAEFMLIMNERRYNMMRGDYTAHRTAQHQVEQLRNKYVDIAADENSKTECNQQALWDGEDPIGTAFAKANIVNIQKNSDARQTVSVDFLFLAYKQKADFTVELFDNKWHISSIKMDPEKYQGEGIGTAMLIGRWYYEDTYKQNKYVGMYEYTKDGKFSHDVIKYRTSNNTYTKEHEEGDWELGSNNTLRIEYRDGYDPRTGFMRDIQHINALDEKTFVFKRSANGDEQISAEKVDASFKLGPQEGYRQK